MTIGHSVTRTIVSVGLAAFAVFCSGAGASAAHRHHSYHRGRAVESQSSAYRRSYSGNLDASCRSAARMGGPCGCWAAEHFFGSPVRNLWLARNWLRFPHTMAAAGTAAVWPNHHHVAPVVAVNGNGTVTVADSWGTHAVRMAGLTFVSPHGGADFDAPRLYAYAEERHRPRRQEAYLQQRHYAGADVYRPDYH
jgi:hypothetical protein